MRMGGCLVESDIAEVEGEGFVNAESGGVEETDEGVVGMGAQRRSRREVTRGVHEGLELVVVVEVIARPLGPFHRELAEEMACGPELMQIA